MTETTTDVWPIEGGEHTWLYDKATGVQTGSITIPYRVLKAAKELEEWMRANQVEQMYGLNLS